MAPPLTLVVGHCTSSSARIFCCGAAGLPAGSVARIGWRRADAKKPDMTTQDIALGPADPFRTGVFDLARLPDGAEVVYAVDVEVPADAGR
jgi:hypothetical protein